MINFSKQILNNDGKGLPQGPAYARYLAEFHLTSLDDIIEKEIKSKGYYYRFVDDMFIILPTKKDIDSVESKIIQHLATKDLSLNEEKTYKGMINSFKIVFEDYVDNTKYFIDAVSKNQNINTQTTIHQASSKLLQLIDNKEGKINNPIFPKYRFSDDNEVRLGTALSKLARRDQGYSEHSVDDG